MAGLEDRLRQLEGVSGISIDLAEDGRLESIRVKPAEGADEAVLLEEIRRILFAYNFSPRRQTIEPERSAVEQAAPEIVVDAPAFESQPASPGKADGLPRRSRPEVRRLIEELERAEALELAALAAAAHDSVSPEPVAMAVTREETQAERAEAQAQSAEVQTESTEAQTEPAAKTAPDVKLTVGTEEGADADPDPAIRPRGRSQINRLVDEPEKVIKAGPGVWGLQVTLVDGADVVSASHPRSPEGAVMAMLDVVARSERWREVDAAVTSIVKVGESKVLVVVAGIGGRFAAGAASVDGGWTRALYEASRSALSVLQ